METCCVFTYEVTKEAVLLGMVDTAAQLQKDAELVFGEGTIGRAQRRLFYTMEDESYSLLAKIVSNTSLIFVLISTVVMCLETMDSLKVRSCARQ